MYLKKLSRSALYSIINLGGWVTTSHEVTKHGELVIVHLGRYYFVEAAESLCTNLQHWNTEAFSS